ncbi:MAG: gamma-glutamylcyclotransferase [Solirubrobacterales bacterium]|nr:gamma-glutamylcyclotransferase [Solirubrobacterales bacterium]
MSIAVFGYGSLVSAESASLTLGRSVPPPDPARLRGWCRRWSQARDNHAEEKTFELLDGTLPSHVLGLNVERGEDPAGAVNGVLIELTEAELDRLDIREIRYDRVDVTELVEGAGGHGFERVITYTAKARNFAPEPAAGTVILSSYASAVEEAFGALGPAELDHYRATTGAYPVDVVEGRLTRDEAPPGNPRRW